MEYEEYTNDLGQKYIIRTNLDGSVSYIPTDSANSDYQQYLTWLEAQTPKTTTE